jgi:hypothetical protein
LELYAISTINCELWDKRFTKKTKQIIVESTEICSYMVQNCGILKIKNKKIIGNKDGLLEIKKQEYQGKTKNLNFVTNEKWIYTITFSIT